MIQPTDPVSVLAAFKEKTSLDQHLYALIFGESILNDAVGLILFNTFAQLNISLQQEGSDIQGQLIMLGPTFCFLLFGSILAGLLIGLMASWVLFPFDKRSSCSF